MMLAVIPARGGSKRIPGKNIKPFAGKPMIAWSIEAALASKCFDQVIVSTDDVEIAAVAKSIGAHVPFLRPADLSDDHTGTIPVIAHAARWALERDAGMRYVCAIYATAPFVRVEDIRRGLDILQTNDADYAFSVTSFASPIQRAMRLIDGGALKMFQPEHFHTRSQDLEEAYHDAGQFYWGRTEAWLESKPIFSPRSRAVVLPRFRVQDIDTADDWTRAELMFNALAKLDNNEGELVG